MYAKQKHCRWCGSEYYACYLSDRDGFCKKSCKQALHRAYKKYVTEIARFEGRRGARSVTHKKRRKKKKH